jgi:DNA segregation ATPase FtsK/SpoIIIE-like protein
MSEYGPIGPFCGKGDPLYADAVKAVRAARRGSISTVQRVLRIGYNRAAHMVEAMENDGIVSAPNYKGERLVLAKPTPTREAGE